MPPTPALGGWLAEDALGRLFLTLTSLLFLASSFYAVAYLRDERGKRHSDSRRGLSFFQRARGELHRLPAYFSSSDDSGHIEPAARLFFG